MPRWGEPTGVLRVRNGLCRISVAVFAGSFLSLFAGSLRADDNAPSEATSAPATESPTAPEPVNFVNDIQPILLTHCYKCHGPDRRSGGLRLDTLEYARAGGDSNKPVIGGSLETNELYARVSSPDRTYRMPKNAEALPPDDIARIKEWVEQKTPWPVVSKPVDNAGFGRHFVQWFESWTPWIDQYKTELSDIVPYAAAFVLAQIAILGVGRLGKAYERNRPWATGRLQRLGRFSAGVKPREQMLLWMLMVISLGVVVLRAHQLATDRALAQLKARQSPGSGVATAPPVPVRMRTFKQFGGIYYRGNCERNSALFNNGNYLTATFRLSLCDAQHQEVHIGDTVSEEGLMVRLELQRAPGTADGFFSPEMISAVFLSSETYGVILEPLKDRPARLETLEEGQRWVAYVPLGARNAAHKLASVIYVYTGRIEEGKARGTAHYGIVYALEFEDGKLSDESDLWMNSFAITPAVADPQDPSKVPFHEWFSDRPLPVMTGENSTDPKILGLTEYINKGLISPDAANPPTDRPQPPTPHSNETPDSAPLKTTTDLPASPQP